MASRVAPFSLLVSLAVTSLSCVAGAALVPGLSLPDPALVNAFLRSTNLSNPLFAPDAPRPLQVVRCDSRTGGGPAYQLYQAQAPNATCENAPPELTAVRPNTMPLLKYKALTLFVFASLFLGPPCFAVGFAGLCFVLLAPLLKDVLTADAKGDADAEPRTPPQCEGTSAPEGTANSSAHSLEVEGQSNNEPRPPAPLTACLLLVLLLLALHAAVRTPAAMRQLVPATHTVRLGPVGLPDPAQGLNQYLACRNASLALALCATANITFYVGFPDSCARLGDPYGARLPKIPFEPESAFLIWVEMCMFMTGAMGIFHRRW